RAVLALRRPPSPPSLAQLGERATVAPRGRLKLNPIQLFPPRSASRNEEMEKRSRQRVRDQVALRAFGADRRDLPGWSGSAKAMSISCALPTLTTWRASPSLRAASCASRVFGFVFGLAGLTSRPIWRRQERLRAASAA